ncbi:Gfo/Idh/MocA family oxidoreductase [soil metagenome]
MTPLNLAIIGCGIAANDHHLPALEKLRRKFRITWACNRTVEKARVFAQKSGAANWTTDFREALADPEVDAVSIILPVELNLPVTRASLAAGKHVLVEKPLAATMRECRAMVKLAEETELVTMVAENYRFRPALRKIRVMNQRGDFGDVYGVQWAAAGDLAPETNKYAHTQWRLDHKYPGGFPMDGGVHTIHAIRYLFGEITEVRGFTQQINPILGDVDTHHMEFETAAGTRGVFCHYFSAKGYREDRLKIFGTAATAILEKGKLTLFRRGKAAREIDLKDDPGYVGEYETFNSAITKKTPVETNFHEGLMDFRVVEASLRSAKSGKTIRL